jgi:uncharacterized membrane protein
MKKNIEQIREECATLEKASIKGKVKIYHHRRGWVLKGWGDVSRQECDNYLRYAQYNIT